MRSAICTYGEAKDVRAPWETMHCSHPMPRRSRSVRFRVHVCGTWVKRAARCTWRTLGIQERELAFPRPRPGARGAVAAGTSDAVAEHRHEEVARGRGEVHRSLRRILGCGSCVRVHGCGPELLCAGDSEQERYSTGSEAQAHIRVLIFVEESARRSRVGRRGVEALFDVQNMRQLHYADRF